MVAAHFRENRLLFSAVVLSAFLGAALAGSLLLAGCARSAPPSAQAPPALAHLTVINRTDYEWRIVVSRPMGALIKDSRLQRRATATVDVPGGDYVVEQIALVESAGPDLSRKIPVRLEAGQTYRWQLVTLLSESAEGAEAR